MDTSETYIKMCEEAEEIQSLRQCDPMSWYYHKGFGCNEVVEGRNLVNVALSIWLPRQDQLQEMVDIGDWITVLSRFAIFAFGGKRVIDGTPHNVFTMEQLWLAFCMHEKYNKVWNGEEWIKS